MNPELLYIAGYLQAMKDMKDKVLAQNRFDDRDKQILLNDCDSLIGRCEHTQHIQEISQNGKCY